MAQALNTIMIALIATTGGIGLIALGLGLAVVHISSKNKRLRRDVESHGFEIPEAEVEEVPRQRSILRRSTKFGFRRPNWNQLESTESIEVVPHTSEGAALNEPEDWTKRPRIPNPPKIPKVKRLRALRSTKSSPLVQVENIQGSVSLSNLPSPPPPILNRAERACPHGFFESIDSLPTIDGASMPAKPVLAFVGHKRSGSQEELRPLPLFSGSMDKFSKSEPRARKKRSQTVGAGTQIMEDPFGISKDSTAGSSRPSMHGRSFSFGSQLPGTVPTGPVPPLPVAHSPAPRPRSWLRTRNLQRPISRQSASSFESIGSSLLVGSPKVNRSVSARMRIGANREWKSSVVHGPRPIRKAYSMHDRAQTRSNHKSSRSQKSIHSLEGQYSNGSSVAHHSANPSQRNSALHLLNHTSGVLLDYHSSNSTTPSKIPRLATPSVSPKRLSAIQPQSSGSPKSTGVSSTRSSNGNPFQWESSSMQPGKPSAMKDSPTARKGHKRQQCVRISVPATVIGSRARSPTSSMVMADILEEGAEMTAFKKREGNSRPRSLPRPPSTSVFNPDLRTALLRASLTPSSPSLSMVNFSNEPSEHEHRNALITRRPSTRLSMFEIPSFPSPVKPPKHLEGQATFSYDRPMDKTNPHDQTTGIPDEFRLLATPISPTNLDHDDVHDALSSSEDSLQRALMDSHQAEHEPDTMLQPGEMILRFDSDRRIQVSPDHVYDPEPPMDNDQYFRLDSPPVSPKSQAPPPRSHTLQKPVHIPGLTLLEPVHTTSCVVTPDPTDEKITKAESPLRDSALMLRRMNSDMRKHTSRVQQRRYMNLGRDVSPIPRPRRSSAMPSDDGQTVPGLGDSREDSMLEVQTEIDDMLAPERVGATWNVDDVEHLLDLQEFDALSANAEALEPLVADRDDSETFGVDDLHGVLQNGVGKGSRNSMATTTLNVWEDRDEYWHQDISKSMESNGDGSRKQDMASGTENWNPLHEHPVNRAGMDGSVGSLHGRPGGTSMVLGNGTTPLKVNIVPPSNNGTPGSMYDASGFLRGS